MIADQLQGVLLKSIIFFDSYPKKNPTEWFKLQNLHVHEHCITVTSVFNCFNTENETRGKKPVYYIEYFYVKYSLPCGVISGLLLSFWKAS